MPSIPVSLKRSVFYLYRDKESAHKNEAAGGTGFFLFMESTTGKKSFYAITNRHVIEKGLAPVIRVNTFDGGFDTIPLTIYDWFNHPDGADVAVASIEFDNGLLEFSAVPYSILITKKLIDSSLIMLGEDVFMLGRFTHYAGKLTNIPTARSGIISAFPDSSEPMPVRDMKPQEAFLIEMRSLSGFSGSPTFHILPIFDFAEALKITMSGIYNIEVPVHQRNYATENYLWLLGIDSGNFPMYENVIEKIDGKEEKTNFKAMNHSGFSIVIPAWKIAETLNRPEFIMDRKNGRKKPR